MELETAPFMEKSILNFHFYYSISSQDSEGVVRNVHKIALEMLQRWLHVLVTVAHIENIKETLISTI